MSLKRNDNRTRHDNRKRNVDRKLNNNRILREASFNPDIKKYLLVSGTVVLCLSMVGIPFIIFWLPIAPYFIQKYFERLECELTDRSLRFQKGYIFQTEKNIPLDKIQDLTFKKGPLLNYFGLTILQVETAGNSAQTNSDLKLIGIVDASEFRSHVLEQRDKVTANTTEEDEDRTLQVLKEIRDSVRNLEALLQPRKDTF